MVYAVIDTNIIVSSFITKNSNASTRRVINSMLSGKIKPLYNDEILEEYFDVLNRSKFNTAMTVPLERNSQLSFLECNITN